MTAVPKADRTEFGHKLKIWTFSKWDVKTVKDFDELLFGLESTPSSKILITQMVKCSWLYEPVKPGPFSFDQRGVVKAINEYRESRRAKLYLLDKDLIKTADSGGGKTLYLTSRGQKIFYEEYPLAILRKQKWDGNWVVVTYDFPETIRRRRDYFRRKLVRLGFGTAQESLLICPLPLESAIEELIEGEGITDYVWVLKAQRVLGLENSEVAKRAWNLGKLNNLYGKLLEIRPRLRKSQGKDLKKEWEQLFLAVDLADPYLPFELLPDDWLGEECKKQFFGPGISGFIRSLFSS